MPKLAHHANGNENQRARCLGLDPSGSASVVGSVGKAEAAGFFVLAAKAGARLAWQRYRAGVRGGFPNVSSSAAQIGARMRSLPQKAAVEPLFSRFGRPRRPASGRVCWLPCFRRHGHEAGGLQQIQALSTLTTWSCPVHPIRGTRPIDATNNNHRLTAAQQRAGRRRGRSTRGT